MEKLKDKVAIISGSGTGIGRVIAIAMAKEGALVVTNNREPRSSGQDAESTAKEIIAMGGKAVPFFGDISDYNVAQRFVQKAINTFGKVDILVNNAAGEDEHFMPWDMTEDAWDNTIRTHLKGTYNCIRHASGFMKEQQWGRIINTTSRAWVGTVNWSNYGTAKAGIVGLTWAVARDIGKYGVTCNAYAPRTTTRRLTPFEIQRFKQAYQEGIYTKRNYESLINAPTPEAMAPLVVFLATEEAAKINGEVFGILGGEIYIYSHPEEKKVIRKENGLWTIEELINEVPSLLM